MLVPVLIFAITAPAAAQNQVPPALQNLKPHQMVEAVMAERQALGFTEIQVRRLDSLHQAVLNEPHRYERTPSPKTHRNVRMKPMISKRQAYADALTILTADQRSRAGARFTDPEYRLPEQLQARRTGGQDTATDPLQRHTAGAAPAGQAADTGKPVTDPLQHRGDAQAPPAVEGKGGKPTNPVTHKQ
jgi:hypothetical protein